MYRCRLHSDRAARFRTPAVIPTPLLVIASRLRRSRNHPRHCPPSTSFPQPPTSFPRRRESSGRVRRAPIAIPAQTYRTNRTVFDRTELAYYSRPMTTITKPYPKETAPCAKHPDSQPRHSTPQTVTRRSTPNRIVLQDRMPNSRSAEFDRIRHNATQYDNIQRKFVPARAREAIEIASKSQQIRRIA